MKLGKSFDIHYTLALVGVASLEEPTLRYVKQGDARQQLPHPEARRGGQHQRIANAAGGPFLDAATIDQIKSWIASGAPSN
jgi:hypothetical protein